MEIKERVGDKGDGWIQRRGLETKGRDEDKGEVKERVGDKGEGWR